MISINVSGLAFRVGVRTILEDVTFAAEEGDRVGIIGVNGCGKSTLFRLIAGRYKIDEGTVSIAKDREIGLLEQDDAFHTVTEVMGVPVGDTVLTQMYAAFPALYRDEIRIAELEKSLEDRVGCTDIETERLASEYAMTHDRYVKGGGLQYKSMCVSILAKLGFDSSYHGMSVSQLSGGQRTRLALARLLCREPDILMLDEPTNHLDTETMMWLESHLAAYKKTVLIISHDRYFLDRVTNKTLEIEYLRAKLYPGNYSRFVELKKFDRDSYEKRYRQQQKEIERLEKIIEQQKRWDHYITAFSKQKQLDRIERLDKPSTDPRSIRFKFTGSGESGNDVLTVKNLSMSFGSHKLYSDLSFLVKKKERVFIAGANGSGKSTLVKLMLGQLQPTAGDVEFGYNVTVGYYDQENQNLDPSKTILDELWDAYPTLTMTEVRNALALFLFRGEDIEKQVSVLSGGERARLTLCKLILSKMNVLILDEPTNHLDISSREALESALLDFDGTLIAVSHDRYFANRLATRVIELDADGCRDYRCTYGEYLDSKSVVPVVKQTEEPSANKEKFLAAKQEASVKRREERQRKLVADEIEKLEGELVDIDDELFGEAATDYVRAAELTDRKTTVEDRLMQLYAEEEKFTELNPDADE